MEEEQKEKLIKLCKRFWWVILLAVVLLISPFLPKDYSEYGREGQLIVDAIQKPESKEELIKSFEKAEELYGRMDKENTTDETFLGNKKLLKKMIDGKDSIMTMHEPVFAQQAYAKRFNVVFNPLDGSCYALTKAIKNSMHNPDSYDHVKSTFKAVNDSTFYVEQTCRGTNAYGGVITVTYNGVVTLDGELLSINQK